MSRFPNPPKVVVTIEARIASTRLPGKVMYPLAGIPMLEQIVRRARRATKVDNVVIATTISPADQVIRDLAQRINCPAHAGPVDDISERLAEAATDADIIVQITGDCPLVDPHLIDHAVEILIDQDADYVCNSLHGLTYPIGFDVRAFTKQALIQSMELSDDPIDRVHGCYFIARRPDLFKQVGWDAPADLRHSTLRVTVDEPTDYALVQKIYDTLFPINPDFGVEDVIELIQKHPEWTQINSDVQQRNVSQG